MGPRPTPPPTENVPLPGEFRPYRRFVSWFILTFVTLGSTYLLISVAVTIYRRRNAVPSGDSVGTVATAADLESCHEELKDVTHGLARHLENFQLIAHYDASRRSAGPRIAPSGSASGRPPTSAATSRRRGRENSPRNGSSCR